MSLSNYKPEEEKPVLKPEISGHKDVIKETSDLVERITKIAAFVVAVIAILFQGFQFREQYLGYVKKVEDLEKQNIKYVEKIERLEKEMTYLKRDSLKNDKIKQLQQDIEFVKGVEAGRHGNTIRPTRSAPMNIITIK